MSSKTLAIVGGLGVVAYLMKDQIEAWLGMTAAPATETTTAPAAPAAQSVSTQTAAIAPTTAPASVATASTTAVPTFGAAQSQAEQDLLASIYAQQMGDGAARWNPSVSQFTMMFPHWAYFYHGTQFGATHPEPSNMAIPMGYITLDQFWAAVRPAVAPGGLSGFRTLGQGPGCLRGCERGPQCSQCALSGVRILRRPGIRWGVA